MLGSLGRLGKLGGALWGLLGKFLELKRYLESVLVLGGDCLEFKKNLESLNGSLQNQASEDVAS